MRDTSVHRIHGCYSEIDLDLKHLLKRSALLTAANWQTVVIQFVAETTFQVLLAARKIKTSQEIALLDQSAGLVDAVYEEIYRMLRPGVYEHEIGARAHQLPGGRIGAVLPSHCSIAATSSAEPGIFRKSSSASLYRKAAARRPT